MAKTDDKTIQFAQNIIEYLRCTYCLPTQVGKQKKCSITSIVVDNLFRARFIPRGSPRGSTKEFSNALLHAILFAFCLLPITRTKDQIP